MNTKHVCGLLACLALAGCERDAPAPPPPKPVPAAAAPAAPPSRPATLKEARQNFRSALIRQTTPREPIPVAPPDVFRTTTYDAAAGKLAAFVTPDPNDGKKHPAIVWITGGDCNSIGDVWTAAPASNDQTAAAYREAGVVMLFPSLRGGNENPGQREGFLGEVDDVIAAADHLAALDYVDPDRIYLGGHSTGGTLVLLAAEYSDRFRAVFSFGPVDEIAGYGSELLPFDTHRPQELELRSPGRWLGSIRSPTFVFEGLDRGNAGPFHAMNLASTNPRLSFVAVDGADHFSVLAPMNRLIARKILADAGPAAAFAFPDSEIRDALR
ncbi:alpha/beta hydrolase family protein [Tahibacter caeni]|uniref:alpha/beta hydrolase family protein n=1 Tax=Tahibacter caeni TaxID=1453545 RepID=UPI0021497D5B|nr:prolyl oligopeptidase family serine peptidase [Tahibacter caeni]